jgi:mRNA interferase MazF
MKKGDIILVPFPFTDLLGNKNRPALVLINSPEDVTVSFITTQFQWKSEFDIEIEPTSGNGLKRKSLIRLNKFATLDKEIVLGKLGELHDNAINQINQKLIQILQLQK